MSTDHETVDETPDAAGPDAVETDAAGTDVAGTDVAGTDAAGTDATATEAAAAEAAAPSEAEAELAAQRELRERIEQRKAEKDGPIAAGTKLNGKAADLLAAVRAVESGEKVDPALLAPPAPAPVAERA
ncbi:hypothetical protein HY68_21720, partial [Streptomyces sp. AcH 505]